VNALITAVSSIYEREIDTHCEYNVFFRWQNSRALGRWRTTHSDFYSLPYSMKIAILFFESERSPHF
jgi:hypothetical protein